MRKMITLLAVLVVMTMGVCSAYADTPAREGMIAYSGTEAFTHLTAEEREACTSWLVYGGEMSDACKKATMKLIAEAPDAVTAEQRKALTAAASGNTVDTGGTTAQKPKEVPQEKPKAEISKKKDYTGHAIVLGLGILAGLIIHNNTKHHRASPPEPHHFAPQPGPNMMQKHVADRRPTNPPRRPAPNYRPPRR